MKKIYPLFLALVCLFSIRSFAQCTTPTTTPYFEDFQNITANGQLPNCWVVSNPSTCLTYTGSGSANYAGFYYSPSGDNYFYSNAFQLTAGVTYSVASWYNVSSNTTLTWTDFSILIGSSQSTTGLVPIASTNGNVVNVIYSALTNTFTVPLSGIYYIAIKATSNGVVGANFLNWDDLQITVPCTSVYNTPTINLALSSNSVCIGSSITYTASGSPNTNFPGGAINTVTFSGGAGNSTTISVVGTNTLTGCSTVAAASVLVYSAPNVLLISPGSICAGNVVNMTALGAVSYTWNGGQNTSTLSVTPSVSTIYTVTGSNAYGCTNTQTTLVTVFPLSPIIPSSLTSNTICAGETITLTATGAPNYMWTSNSAIIIGTSITASPTLTTVYNVAGADDGCYQKGTITVSVIQCLGIETLINSTFEKYSIYPNPGNGEFIIESNTTELKSILITDVTGKKVFSESSSEEKTSININDLSDGIYQIRISSEGRIDFIKIVKLQ